MPLRNRVTPFSQLEAVPARGTLMGNRGILHDANRHVARSTWTHKRWIACVLSFKGRRRVPMSPRHYTELFFLDEAVSLAAGHRPCCECRRADHLAFVSAWRRAFDVDPGRRISIDEIDAILHRDRVTQQREQRLFASRLADLPAGAFVRLPDRTTQAWLVWGGALHRWTHEGYDATRPLAGDAMVEVVTPRLTVEVLRAGYEPGVHDSAVTSSGSTT